ncbi:hypothetical protein PACILC2_22880 [Paenibacillus cisolokensis]|uniref:Uncharacterized protein n=1 Tax=Paenibacillus cisolokensis TaxID=1658519 RepID=A0ABQ4N669_9BACL|nr:hypothetical protein [Paenibacillus cisolokensis]GIQ63720.1 hypothetical protein PACILC2_22880 [Paenibacillus cisolokensis]
MARMQIEALNAAQEINFTETKIGKRLPSDLSKFIDVAGDYVLSGMSKMVQSQANEHIARLNQLERDLQNITIGAFDQFNEGGAKNSYGTGALDLDKKKKPKKERTKREKTAAELQQEAYRASLAYIDYMRNVGKMTEEQEIAALERLLKRYQKNTEIRRDAEVRIYRIREQLEADAEKREEEARKKAEKDAKDAVKKRKRSHVPVSMRPPNGSTRRNGK